MLRSLIAVTSLAMFSACQPLRTPESPLQSEAEPAFELAEAVLDTSGVENPNSPSRAYVSLGVPFQPVNAVKKAIEERTGLTLTDRGEAHVTLVTPPELQALRSRLSGPQILAALGNGDLQSEALEIPCVGSGSKVTAQKTQTAYFLIVHSEGLFERRRHLEQAFQAAGGLPGRFEADHFYPHVTIGFTHVDLHEQDGVIKDDRACIAPVELVP